jgi:hypothetical protein
MRNLTRVTSIASLKGYLPVPAISNRENSFSGTVINPSLERRRQVLDGPYAGTDDRKTIDHSVNWHLNPSTL